MDELWSEDRDVLRWVVEQYEPEERSIHVDELYAAFPDRRDAVGQSLRRLVSHDYLAAATTSRGLGSSGPPIPLKITAVRERALRAVGAWPDDAELLADRILAVLTERAEKEPEPDKRSKFQAGLRDVSGMTRDVLVDVLAAAITRGMPGGA